MEAPQPTTPPQEPEVQTPSDSSDTPKTEISDKKNSQDSHWQRFISWYKADKRKSIPLTVLALLVLIIGVPWSRYHAAGLALKKDLQLQIMDSSAHTPVSGATVTLGLANAITDASGKVTLHHVPVGSRTILISKKYYKDRKVSVLVPIFSQKTTPDISFVATGRAVKVVVSDLINGQKLSGVDIEAADVKVKTDKSGTALIVLPVSEPKQAASLSFKGYNDAKVTIQVSGSSAKENDFKLTPAGQVYFLSKLSGKIDVVKTNLDGSDRQTVLAGTGHEDDRSTVLLASRDWKYLALLARRDTSAARLYLIDTANNDELTTIDQGATSSFNLVGWSDDNFIYTVSRSDVPAWQPKAQALKSYNAANKQLLSLDQTRAGGTNQYDYVQESYGQVYQIDKTVVYEKNWSAYYTNTAALNSKQAGVYSIGAGGANAHSLKTFGYEAGKTTYINSIPYEAGQIYYQVTEKDQQSYYSYSNGKISARSDLADDFNSQYKNLTYLQSPSGNNTFWAEARDGKNTLFIGDTDGHNGKQIASLSDYFTYGWFSDSYLLVSKNASELYVMARGGPSEALPPVKISDYHKPAQTFNGYGGGYGGI